MVGLFAGGVRVPVVEGDLVGCATAWTAATAPYSRLSICGRGMSSVTSWGAVMVRPACGENTSTSILPLRAVALRGAPRSAT
ncbi:hypothetical protein, partial [Streptomyces albidoflavus]|uniref:hypothetical protein n=1 Tax=Streptomyces albidoflavus TaxID=1886 RepID=UPI00340049D2